MQAIETVWLAGRDYVAGDHVSLADLLMCCELEQLVMLEAADPEVTHTSPTPPPPPLSSRRTLARPLDREFPSVCIPQFR